MITTPRLLLLPLAVLGLASCQSTQNNTDPYASNAGGGYNPYPDQGGGYASNAAPSYQQPPAPTYSTPPSPAPPPSDPYAYSAPKTTSSSSSKPKSTAGTSTKKKSTSTASSTKKKTSSSGKRYAVKQGDTLYGIARKNGTSVAKIKAANGLSSDLIRPGQSLKIP